MKNKIIISSYDDITNPFYSGGGARALHELAKYLGENFEVEFLSCNQSGVAQEWVEGVFYNRISFRFLSPRISMLAFQIALPFFARFKKYDLWIESFGPPFTTSFLPIFTKKPVLGILHMLASEDMKRKYKIDVSFLEKLGLRMYPNIVVTSNSFKDKIQNITHKSNCIVIPNGIKSRVQHKGRKKQQILYLGRIEINQKGLDLLLEAFEEISKKHMDFSLVIAGDGLPSEIQALSKVIRMLNLQKRVVLLGRVGQIEKNKLLAESQCIVIPSRFETFSLVALESLNAGLPIICFDIEGLKWLPESVVIKCSTPNSKCLASSIEVVLNNARYATQLAGGSRRFSKKFDIEAIHKTYLHAINELIGGNYVSTR